MSLTFTPLATDFGATVEGLTLSMLKNDTVIDSIKQAYLDYSVLLIRGLTFSPDLLIAFSRQFGQLDQHRQSDFLLPEKPEILVIGNSLDGTKRTGLFVAGDGDWHSDGSYLEYPTSTSLLYAITIPPTGGDTLFTSMTTAYETLSEQKQRQILPLRAIHDYGYFDDQMCLQDPQRKSFSSEQRQRVPPISQPIVRVHSETHKKSLYMSPDMISHVEGLPKEDGLQLIKELADHATKKERVYRHVWQENDLLIWDNQCTMHKATPFKNNQYSRILHRTTIKGDKPIGING